MKKTNKRTKKEEMRDVSEEEIIAHSNSIPDYPSFTFHGLSNINISVDVRRKWTQGGGANSNLFPAVYNINSPISDASLCLTEQEYNLLKDMYKDDAKSIENFEEALNILMNLRYLSYVQSNGFMTIRINLLGCIKYFGNVNNEAKMYTNKIFDWDAFKEILHTAALFGYLKMKSTSNYTGNKIPYLNIEMCGITDLKEHLIDSKINMNDGLMYLQQEFKNIYNEDIGSHFGDNRFQITEEVFRSIDKLIELCIYKYAEMTIYNDLEMYYNLVDKKTITETFYEGDNAKFNKIDEDIRRTIQQKGLDVDAKYVSSKNISLCFEKLILNEPFRKSRDFKNAPNDYLETFLSVAINDLWRYSPYTSFFYREDYCEFYYLNCRCENRGETIYLEKTKDFLKNHIRFSDVMSNAYKDYIENKLGVKNNQREMKAVKLRFNVTFNRQLLSNYYYSNLFTKNILNKLDNKTMSGFRLSVNNKLLHNPLFSAIMARLANTNELGTEQEYSTSLSKSSIYSNKNAISLCDDDKYVFSDNVSSSVFKETYQNPFLSDIDDDDLISTFFTLMSLEIIAGATLSPYKMLKEVKPEDRNNEIRNYLNYPFNKFPQLPPKDCFNKHNMGRKISDIIWDGTSDSKRRPQMTVGFKEYFDTLIRSNAKYTTYTCDRESEEGYDTVMKLEYLTKLFDDSDWFRVVVLNFRNLVTKLHKSYISYISLNMYSDSHNLKNRKIYKGTDAVSNKLFHINYQLNKILDYLEDHSPSVNCSETRDVKFIKSLIVSIANLYSEFEPNGWLFIPSFNAQRYKNLYLNNFDKGRSKANDEKVVRLDFLAIGDLDYQHLSPKLSDKAVEYEKRISVEYFYSTKVNSNHHISTSGQRCNPYKVHQSEYMLDRIRLNYINATEENFDDIKYLKTLERDINILLDNTSSKEQFGRLLFKEFDENKNQFKDLTIDKSKWVLMYYNDIFMMNFYNELLPLSIGSSYAGAMTAGSKGFMLEESENEREDGIRFNYSKFKGFISFKSLLWVLTYSSYIDDVSYPISNSDKHIRKMVDHIFNNFERKNQEKYVQDYEDEYFGDNFRFGAYDFSIAAYPNLNKSDGDNPYDFFYDSLEHEKPFSISDIKTYIEQKKNEHSSSEEGLNETDGGDSCLKMCCNDSHGYQPEE